MKIKWRSLVTPHLGYEYKEIHCCMVQTTHSLKVTYNSAAWSRLVARRWKHDRNFSCEKTETMVASIVVGIGEWGCIKMTHMLSKIISCIDHYQKIIYEYWKLCFRDSCIDLFFVRVMHCEQLRLILSCFMISLVMILL